MFQIQKIFIFEILYISHLKNLSAMKNRKRNRMIGFDYAANNLYFVTNCVKNNWCCLGRVIPVGTVGTGRDLSVHHAAHHHAAHHDLGNIHPAHHDAGVYSDEIEYKVALNPYGEIVEERINWLKNQYQYVDIHNYVVMPNHFHIIIEIDSQKVDENVEIKSLSGLMGALQSTSSKQIHELGFKDFAWHRSFHDHIIRNEKSYHPIFNYISKNSKNWAKDRFYSK